MSLNVNFKFPQGINLNSYDITEIITIKEI